MTTEPTSQSVVSLAVHVSPGSAPTVPQFIFTLTKRTVQTRPNQHRDADEADGEEQRPDRQPDHQSDEPRDPALSIGSCRRQIHVAKLGVDMRCVYGCRRRGSSASVSPVVRVRSLQLRLGLASVRMTIT